MWRHTSCHCAVGGQSSPNLNQLFTRLADGDRGGVNICSVEASLPPSPPKAPFPLPSEHATLEDVAQMSGLGSKSNALRRASGIARCPPSVCVTCQMSCHHQHHQSKLHQSVCACVRLHMMGGQTWSVHMHDFTSGLLTSYSWQGPMR